MLNESLTLGTYLNEINWYFGGITGLTTAYVIIIVYLYYKNYQLQKKNHIILQELRGEKMNRIEDDPEQLETVLKALQQRIETTPYQEEATQLRGSYGVYLYHLRKINTARSLPYIDWMHEHTK